MPSSIDADAHALSASCARTLAGSTVFPLDLQGVVPAALRGVSDAAACHRRFRLPPGVDVAGSVAAVAFFDALARARAEALGHRWLPGIASNLRRRDLPTSSAYGRLHRHAFQLFVGDDPGDCPPALSRALAVLAEVLDHPAEFSQRARVLCLSLADEPGAEVAEEGDQTAFTGSAADVGLAAQANVDDAGEAGEETGEEEVASRAEETDAGLPGAAPPPLSVALAAGYPIFSTRFDRVVEADTLASPAELDALRAQLDHALIPYGQLVSRLAQRLQRLLLARQSRHWSLDQEAGLIDASRLARFIANPGDERIFRVEAECPFPQTAVTLLIDNSGSMRGHPITVAALTADVLARSLERCDVKVEILGYTTSDVAQATLLGEWQRAGGPAGAGRLNGLRHIVYKAMDSPWHRSRRRLGLMLKDSLLKENIDGEALWWACQRLLRRPEPRRLLIVISDGAPMDKNTLAANSRSFLEAHLHQVVGWITRQTDIELRAIGIGFPVARYYPKSVSLAKVDELGSVLIRQLGDWLS